MTISIEITSWRADLQMCANPKPLQDHAGLSLSAAKGVIDRVLAGEAITVTMSSLQAAETTADQLRVLGANVRVLGAPEPRLHWVLLRQDSKGLVLIGTFGSKSEALIAQADYGSRNPERAYWITAIETKPAEESAAP